MEEIIFDESFRPGLNDPGLNDFGRALLLSTKEAYQKAFRLQFGGFGAACGFIVAFIGAGRFPKSDPSTENSE